MVCDTDVVRNISIPGLRWILRFLLRPGLSFLSKVRSSPLSLVLQNALVKRLVFFCHE